MSTEREVLIAILKLTREGPAELEEVSREARVPIQTVRRSLRKAPNLSIARLEAGKVSLSGEQRLRAAIKAVEMGTDIERVCKFLTWTEFEDIALLAFRTNDFVVRKHLRFSWAERRWEIDILALKEPVAASVDCKQWHRGWSGSASTKAAELQIQRTQALSEASTSIKEKLVMRGWKRAYFVPIVLSLTVGAPRFIRDVPIVPVLQLRSFLQEMPAYIGSLTRFRVDF